MNFTTKLVTALLALTPISLALPAMAAHPTAPHGTHTANYGTVTPFACAGDTEASVSSGFANATFGAHHYVVINSSVVDGTDNTASAGATLDGIDGTQFGNIVFYVSTATLTNNPGRFKVRLIGGDSSNNFASYQLNGNDILALSQTTNLGNGLTRVTLTPSNTDPFIATLSRVYFFVQSNANNEDVSDSITTVTVNGHAPTTLRAITAACPADIGAD